jgi:malyl-CoA/(S)-citramalyl-CoA lyase
MKLPSQFYKPLAIGAPEPMREVPVKLERMIHFLPPQIAKMRAKVPDLISKVDVILGNLEDAIPADDKEAARDGFIEMALAHDYGQTGLWTRINCLNSPWALDDITKVVLEAGHKLDVMMLPKVEGAWDIHYLDQLLAQLEARAGVQTPIMIHAILETAQGVKNVEEIAAASPRMHGMSLGPADLAASRGMKTTRVGGGHPAYGVLADNAGNGQRDSANRAFYQQDLWHYTVAKMVDACQSNGIKAFYGPFGDFSDPTPAKRSSATPSCKAVLARGRCTRRRSTSPSGVLARRRAEVKFALRILEAMPDGTGAVMIDGKMQDDATWKQAKVIADLARLVAEKDPGMAAAYGL